MRLAYAGSRATARQFYLHRPDLHRTGRTYHDADNVSSNRNGQIRIGVVGGGLVAQAMHLPYLSELTSEFDLAALAEPSQTVREALAARYGIPGAYADWRSLVDAGNLDAILIASPAGTHLEIVLAALDAGLHVFCEKPICLSVADVDRVIAAPRPRREGRPGRLHEAPRPGVPPDAVGAPAHVGGHPLHQHGQQRPGVGPLLPHRRRRARQRRARGGDRAGQARRERAGRGGGRPRRSGSGVDVLGRLPRLADPPGERRPRVAAEDGRAAARARRRCGLVARRQGSRRLPGAGERRALGQCVAPALRHARVPRVDRALLHRQRPVADVPVTLAEDEPDRLRAARRRRLRRSPRPASSATRRASARSSCTSTAAARTASSA